MAAEIYASGNIPQRADTQRMLLVKMVNATITGGGGVTGVYAGNGSPVGVVVPAGVAAVYVQADSTPPGQLWEFYSGAWH